jgi:hypothetical protein
MKSQFQVGELGWREEGEEREGCVGERTWYMGRKKDGSE